MVGIVDYGVGNLFSLRSSLAVLGAETLVSGDGDALAAADRLILPGVGAFGDAAAALREKGLDQVLRRLAGQGKPLLGICLGMQMLFDYSEEYGRHEGLGLIPGHVAALAPDLPPDKNLKVPHIGWNGLHRRNPVHPLLAGVNEGDCVYFVHSFHAVDCAESVIATAEYGPEVTAAVARGNVMGTQFHPEKSGAVGLGILCNFCEGKGGAV